MFRNRRLERGTSPVPIDRFAKLQEGMNDGEYMILNRIPPPNPPQHRRLRNALILGGLGAAAGAMYRFQQPLLKLGYDAYNYAKDKFHNLYASNTPINATTDFNDHDT